MKTKTQKQEELKKGRELFEKSTFLLFTDFTKIAAEDIRRLRGELRALGAQFLVIKKTLLGLMLQEKHITFDADTLKVPIGTVFATELEKAAGVIFKFLKNRGAEKEKILGGYDLRAMRSIDADTVRMIGALPPREVLLGQLFGMIAAPIRSLLYVLKEKSKKVGVI